MRLSQKTTHSQKRYRRNIFVTKEVASFFEKVRLIPDEVMRGVASDILSEILRLKGGKERYNILEVGMGTGRFFRHMEDEAEKNSKIWLYGMDSSKAALKQAESTSTPKAQVKRTLHNITTPLPYPPSFFDASVSFYTYHCIADWRRALRNVLQMTSDPQVIVFMREKSPWGFYLDNKFTGIPVEDDLYYKFWKKYFFERESIVPLPKRDISASNLGKLFDYLERLGFRHEKKFSKLVWQRKIDFQEALLSIEKGLFTKTKVGLTPTNRKALRQTMERWLDETGVLWREYGGVLNASVEIDYFIKD